MKSRAEVGLTIVVSILAIVGVIALVVGIDLALAWALMWAWNTLAVPVAGLPAVTYLQAVAGMVLLTILRFLFFRPSKKS